MHYITIVLICYFKSEDLHNIHITKYERMPYHVFMYLFMKD